MSDESGGVSGLAGRYALALLDLAESQSSLDQVAGDLQGLKQLINESDDMRTFLRSPLYGRQAQTKAMAAVLEKTEVSDLTRRFVSVVAQNRRLFALSDMIDAYLSELARRRGEVTARVTSAIALSDAQLSDLETALQKIAGGKVQLKTAVDPALLGGLVVRIGSRMFDASLKTKLFKLQQTMKGA